MDDAVDEMVGVDPKAARKQVSPASHSDRNFMPPDALAEILNINMPLKYLYPIRSSTDVIYCEL